MINRSTFTGPLIWSAAAVALCVILVLVGVTQILGAAFARGVGDEKPSEFLARLHTAHERAVETDRQRVNGRNLFYPTRATPKPPPPPPIVQKPDDDTPPPPPPPPPPKTAPPYSGPDMIAMMGDIAWFTPTRAGDKPLMIRAGEEKEGLKVIATAAPWTAKVSWSGWEYDLELFTRQFPGLQSTPPPTSKIEGLQEIAPPAAATSEAPPETEGVEGPIPAFGAAGPAGANNDDAKTADEDGAEADEMLASRTDEPADDRDTERPRPADPKPALPPPPDGK